MKTSESLLKQAEELDRGVAAMAGSNPHTETLLRLAAQMRANMTRMQIAAGLFAVAEAIKEASAVRMAHAPKPEGFVPPKKPVRG